MSQNMMATDTYSNELKVYVNQEKAAVDLLNSVGKLLFDKSIELVLFRNHMVDISATEIMRLHKYAAEVVENLSLFSTRPTWRVDFTKWNWHLPKSTSANWPASGLPSAIISRTSQNF